MSILKYANVACSVADFFPMPISILTKSLFKPMSHVTKAHVALWHFIRGVSPC